MELKIELEKIAKRLFDEGICSQPLSESALKDIFRYMGMSQTGSELMRRLSDVENNYDEISREAEDAVKRVKETITDCDKIFGALINEWDRKGLTDAYSFSKDSSTLSRMYQSYSAMTENLSDKIITIENACDLLAETAAQTKACTASFLEIYYKEKYIEI